MSKTIFGLYIWLVFAFRGYSSNNCLWIYKQAMLETAYLKSTGLINDKNAFGMSRVYKRKTTQINSRVLSDGNTLGKYSSIYSSVKDRYLWDEYFKTNEYRKSPLYPSKVAEHYHKSDKYASSVNAFDGTGFQNSKYLLFASVPLTTYLIQKLIQK